MKETADTKTNFKFLDAYLMVRRVQPNPLTLSAHETVLVDRAYARYNMTRIDLKILTFSAGSNSRSIHNSVLGPLPKRLLFSMIKNSDFTGSVDTNPYKFRHYISEFSLYVNGKRGPSDGLILDMDHDKCMLWAIGHSMKGPAYITRKRDYR